MTWDCRKGSFQSCVLSINLQCGGEGQSTDGCTLTVCVWVWGKRIVSVVGVGGLGLSVFVN